MGAAPRLSADEVSGPSSAARMRRRHVVEGRHRVLQRSKLADVRRGEEILTRAQHLSELDVRRPEADEDVAELNGAFRVHGGFFGILGVVAKAFLIEPEGETEGAEKRAASRAAAEEGERSPAEVGLDSLWVVALELDGLVFALGGGEGGPLVHAARKMSRGGWGSRRG